MKKKISKRAKRISRELSKELDRETKPRTKILQPTMSKTDLLLQCSWWVGKEVPIEEDGGGPEARFGSAFHAVIAWMLLRWLTRPAPHAVATIIKERQLTLQIMKAAKKYCVDPGQLRERVVTSFETLTAWLRDNEYGIDFTKGKFEIEQAYALLRAGTDPNTFRFAHKIDLPDDDHHYDVDNDEFPGTGDLSILMTFDAPALDPVLLIIDHKTGELPSVELSGQLESLALAVRTEITRAPTVIVAINHAPREGGLCTVYSVAKSIDQIDHHAEQIGKAFERIGDGSMRPGPGCQYCDALRICPTQTHALVQLRASKAVTASNVGEIHQRLQQYRKTFAQIDDQITADIKRVIRESGPQERPDGGTTRLEKRSRRELSMASIKRALGEVAGAKEIQRLDKLGVIEAREAEYLIGD